MKTYPAISGNTVKTFYPAVTEPEGLERLIQSRREGLSPTMAAILPLSYGNQLTLLANSHYLSHRFREALLLRLSGHHTFCGPLYYELCDKAGRSARLKAASIARDRDNLEALAMLEEFSGAPIPPKPRDRWTFKKWILGLTY